MLAPVVHILPLTTLRRERLLPAAGRVTARMDQKVSAMDVIAEAHLGKQHVMLDVARSLGIPAEAAQRLIDVKAGEPVSKGQPLAQRNGLLPQIVRSPGTGRVVLVGNGRILIEEGDATFDLQAGLPGKVTRLLPERGVEITFHGALIQGVWGNGQLGMGLMIPIVNAPEEALVASQMDVSLRGSILLAGKCDQAEALNAAGGLPVRGLILGSLASELVPLAAQLPFPVIVLDGFGARPMDAAAYRLLSSNAKREVCVNAGVFDRQTGVKPEIFIPLPVAQEPAMPREMETFAPGQPVRLMRPPHAGAIGTLSGLLPGLTVMPSGIRVPAAEVDLDLGEIIIVPLANLEVLG